MLKQQIIKKKWYLKIPLTFAVKTKNTSVFFHRNQMRHTILNWNLLWFYINYQFKLFKQILLKNAICLLVTDNSQISNQLFILSKNLNMSFIAGNWQGGLLTKIKSINNIPDCVFSFNMLYSKNLYNETAILSIPTINLTNSKIVWNTKGIMYNIPIPTTMNKNLLYFLVTIYIWIIKKNKKYNFYENLILNKEIDSEYINQLQTINFKFKIYSKIMKNYKTQKFFIKTKKFEKNWKIFNIFKKQLNEKQTKNIYFPKIYKIFLFTQKNYILQQQHQEKILKIKKPDTNLKISFNKFEWKNF